LAAGGLRRPSGCAGGAPAAVAGEPWAPVWHKWLPLPGLPGPAPAHPAAAPPAAAHPDAAAPPVRPPGVAAARPDGPPLSRTQG
jgi:hypothetical protein